MTEKQLLREELMYKDAEIAFWKNAETRRRASEFIARAKHLAQVAGVTLARAIRELKAKQADGFKCWARQKAVQLEEKTMSATIKDFLELSRKRAKEDGCSLTEGMKRTARENPEGHKAWVQEQARKQQAQRR